jgi:hypothetical protein
MTDDASFADAVRRTEALFLFGAALPPRDGFDENLYREWHMRDARRPGREVYGRSMHLRSLTYAELHDIAVDNVQAQAERATMLEAEAEAEAGF